ADPSNMRPSPAIILLAAMFSCAPSPPATPPAHLTGPSPSPSVPAPPLPSAAPSVALEPPKPIEARVISFLVEGLAPRVAALRIRAQEPALRACAERAPGVTSTFSVTMGVSDKGAPIEPRAEGAASEALRHCFLDALRALTFDGPIRKNAK